MRRIEQNNDQISTLNRKCSVARVGRAALPKTLAIGILLVLSFANSDWVVQTAMATRLISLKLNGPQTAQAGKPLTGIKVTLVNAGPAAQNARLRLLLIDEADREMQIDDFKVDVLEGKSWTPVPLEPLDGAAMGAIGPDGSGHQERHRRGGFAIPAKWNKLWQLRITFHLPGVYQLGVALSPDNGETHLAQPASLTVEAQ